MQIKQTTHYRIKLTIAVYKDKKLVYRNDMIVPTSYARRSECRMHIKREMQARLKTSNFFISPRMDFDLVRYTCEASCNTFLRYRIVEETPLENVIPVLETKGLNRKKSIAKDLDLYSGLV